MSSTLTKKLLDGGVTINTAKLAASKIDEYEEALQKIVQAKTIEEAWLIAYTALM